MSAVAGIRKAPVAHTPERPLLEFLARPWIAPALLAVGVVLRLRLYLFDRALWLDEAMLSVNIVDRSYRQLLLPLRFNQAAPLGFLWAQRLSVQCFGNSEYALRLVPLLAGIASLFLFYALAKLLLTPAGVAAGVAMLVLSPELVYYSAETKQYSVDVAVCLLILLCAIRLRAWESRRPWVLLGCVGTIAVWFSHPSVFVLAAVGLACLVVAVRSKEWRNVIAIAAAGSAWLGSLGAEYLLLLRTASQNPVLTHYWAGSFAPMPTSFENIRWYVSKFFEVFDDPAGMFRPEIAAVIFLLGLLALWQTDRVQLAVLGLPAVFVLLASAVQKYPFSGRLILFLCPLMFLIIARGLEPVLRLQDKYGRALAVIVFVFLFLDSGMYDAYRFLRPQQREEIRTVMAEAQSKRQPGDLIYVFPDAVPAFLYYAPRFGIRPGEVVLGDPYAGPQEALRQVRNLPPGARVWVLFSHIEPTSGNEYALFSDALQHEGKRIASLAAPGAYADLYQLTPSAGGR